MEREAPYATSWLPALPLKRPIPGTLRAAAGANPAERDGPASEALARWAAAPAGLPPAFCPRLPA
jgi:hypothetical protein